MMDLFRGWSFDLWATLEAATFLGGLMLLANGHYIIGWVPMLAFIVVLGHPKNTRR
jgi:hypothetical protein